MVKELYSVRLINLDLKLDKEEELVIMAWLHSIVEFFIIILYHYFYHNTLSLL